MNQKVFGKTLRGEEATLYTLTNKKGMSISATDYGATLQAVLVPDKGGNLCDVVLGHDNVSGYENDGKYFGATVGRNANRIGNASFVLNDKQYKCDENDGKNNLHGGFNSYAHRMWQVTKLTDRSITFSLYSPDGDQGFPGSLDIAVTYTLTEDNGVQISYYGIADADTIINMTNHSYFNMAGHASGTILGQTMWLDADIYTATDEELIPTGEICPVEGTPMDFRTPKTIGKDIGEDYSALNIAGGYDHNWGLNNHGRFAKVAELSSDISGITMEVYTDLPGIQVYSGNFLLADVGKAGAIYKKNQAVCFETQYFPDAINHDNFSSPVCRANKVYETMTEYRFCTNI